jgi:hypothetical protein
MRWLGKDIEVAPPFAPGEVVIRRARRFHICQDGGIIEKGFPYVVYRTEAFRTGYKYCLAHASKRGLVVVGVSPGG